ncbi:MAG: SDR family oxidoreductase [Pseudomonadales bacterium]|nr:SDR family oxidoreductase [Pseudomonadales bacterium]
MTSIFITGAASGIGAATAKYFSQRGWYVGLSDINGGNLQNMTAGFGNNRFSIHEVDVTKHTQCRRALKDFTEKTNGQLNVLFNNAGILTVAPFEDITPAQHGKIIDINVKGVINMSHAAFPYLKSTPKAQVISMSSASAMYGIPDFSSYSASKFAVRALTEALDIEWEKYDITVSDVMPPFVKTPMVETLTSDSPILKNSPVNLSAEDIAQEVFSLTQSRELHRPVTAQMKLTWQLTRHLPAKLGRQIFKKLYSG